MPNQKILVYTDANSKIPEQLLPTIPVGGGGTGAVTRETALNNLLPTQLGNAGKILQTNGTTHSWETPSIISTVQDSVFRVQDNLDNTKQLAFEVSTVQTGVTATLQVPNLNGMIRLRPDFINDTVSSGAVGVPNNGDIVYRFAPTSPLTANRTITLSNSVNPTGVIIELSFVEMSISDFSTFKFTIVDQAATLLLDITVPTLLRYFWNGTLWRRIF